MTDKAIGVLLAKRQDNELLSQIIEHNEFSDLINAIDIYVRQLAAKSINTINNLTTVMQRGVENYAVGAGMADEYGKAIKYINETKVDEDEFLRYRITERFNQILRDVYDDNANKASEDIPSAIKSTNKMAESMVDVLDMVKAGEVELEDPFVAVALLMEKMNVTDEQVIGGLDAVVEFLDEVEEDMEEDTEEQDENNNELIKKEENQ